MVWRFCRGLLIGLAALTAGSCLAKADSLPNIVLIVAGGSNDADRSLH